MTLAELRTALKRYGFDDEDPLDTWINAAIDEIEVMYLWPWLYKKTTLTLATSVNTLTLPTDFSKVISLRLDDERDTKLSYIDPRTLDREIYRIDPTGFPSAYTVVDDEITVYPVPDEEVTLQLIYLKTVAELVDSGSQPDIPSNLHYTIVRGAAYIALQAENEEERAQTAFAEFESDIQRKWNRLSTPTEDEPDQVQDVMGYGSY